MLSKIFVFRMPSLINILKVHSDPSGVSSPRGLPQFFTPGEKFLAHDVAREIPSQYGAKIFHLGLIDREIFEKKSP